MQWVRAACVRPAPACACVRGPISVGPASRRRSSTFCNNFNSKSLSVCLLLENQRGRAFYPPTSSSSSQGIQQPQLTSRRRTMLSLGEDYSADLDGHCSTECAGTPSPSLEHLPEDLLLALMHKLDGESLACFGRTAKPVHAASSHIPPLVFASRGRLVVFRGSPSRASRRHTI